jgi:outer membrane protein
MRLAIGFLMLSTGATAGALASEPAKPVEKESARETVRWRVSDAVERALASSARLAQRRALERAASADAGVARSARFPSVDFSGGYTHQSDVPELRLMLPNGQMQTLFPNIPENYRMRLSAGWALFTGGRTAGLIRAAEREQEASDRDLEAERQDVILEARTAYWSLVTARQMAQVLREGLGAYDAHLRDAGNREKVGMAARNEVLAVRVEHDRAELALLRAENGAAVAEANLRRLAGLDSVVAVETVEPLAGPVAEPAELEGLVAQALGARPEYAALRARLAAAEARVRVEQSARWPQLNASGGYDYANPNNRIMPPTATWKDSWDVGVRLSLSLFDGGKTSAAVARARARRDAVQAQLDEFTRGVRLQVTQRSLDAHAAQAALAVAERGRESARENRQVAADRYREGLIPSSELLDAEVGLLRAGLDLTDALAQARLAAAGLDRALGK